MRMKRHAGVWAAFALLTGCVAVDRVLPPATVTPPAPRDLLQVGAADRPGVDPGDVMPTGRGRGNPELPRRARVHVKPVQQNGISYHGGPVMVVPPTVYIIWYGNWANNTATTILPAFIASLSGSSYFNINTTYTDAAGTHVKNGARYGGSTPDNYSQGTALTDATVKAVVAAAIARRAFPADPGAVYFVLPSQDVSELSGFCATYCGWHTYATIANQNIKYAFVGYPAHCVANTCMFQVASSPNNNPAADGIANTMAHELEETVTDPNLNAWYDQNGLENADKGMGFGTTLAATNGSVYNMVMGGSPYLIQGNWVNANGGYVAWSY